jgi:hypothetical protein
VVQLRLVVLELLPAVRQGGQLQDLPEALGRI